MPVAKKYVLNPKTGRRVLADGPTGKKILKARRAKRARAAKKRKSCVASCTRKCTSKKVTRRRRPIRRSDYVSNSDVYDFGINDYVSNSDVYGIDIV
ncbi:unnamed protein product [Sphacelaria rigidula]